MTQYYTHAHPYQSRSDTGVRVRAGNQEHSTSYPSQSSTSSQITAVQDTVINLSNVVSAVQQQQAHITNTLCNLTSMMQQSTNSGLQSHNATQSPTNSMYNDQGNSSTDSTQFRSYVNEASAAGQQQGWYSRGGGMIGNYRKAIRAVFSSRKAFKKNKNSGGLRIDPCLIP